FLQARHDVEPGVTGIPLEDWSAALATRVRARPAAIPVKFVAKSLPGFSGLTGLAAVRAGGKDGRDLVFAGEKGLVVAVSLVGYRAGPPIGTAARNVQVADIGNSGALDLVTPGAFWTQGRDGYRKTEL